MQTNHSPNHRPLTERERSIALVLVTMLLFASYDAMSKYMTRYYPVTELLWVRYLIHVVFMLAVFGPKMRLGLIQTRQPVLQVVRALLLIAGNFFFMYGLRFIPLAEATAINFLAPLIVTALCVPMLGEKVETKNWIAVCLGFAGVLIIVRPGSAAFQLGAIFPLLSAWGYSFYQILTRKFKDSEHPLTMHFYTGLVGLVLTMLFWQPDWVMPTANHAFLMALQGIIVGLGHYIMILAISRIGPATVAPFTYTQFIWVLLFSSLVFGEMPSVASLVGIAVIAGSGLYLAYRKKPA